MSFYVEFQASSVENAKKVLDVQYSNQLPPNVRALIGSALDACGPHPVYVKAVGHLHHDANFPGSSSCVIEIKPLIFLDPPAVVE